MGLKDEITNAVRDILSQEWDVRAGTVVPSTEDVKLSGGGVKLDAVMLYADLADSTELVMKQDRRVVAKVYKSFLAAAARLIKSCDGYIRSFDGDRVMGVFLGGSKRNNAVRCGLQLKFAFDEIVKPKILAKYPDIESSAFSLGYTTGIDASDILVVRGGVYSDNDLLWVGQAANVAAKLSAIREGSYRTIISEDVYKNLEKGQKYGAANGAQVDIWTPFTWYVIPGMRTFYKSHWRQSFS